MNFGQPLHYILPFFNFVANEFINGLFGIPNEFLTYIMIRSLLDENSFYLENLYYITVMNN